MAARTVRTAQGQAWDQLSRSEYGEEKLLHTVVEANADEADTVLFSGNMPVFIPDVNVTERKRALDLLPPWERV